jgi:ribosomal protein L11 methylase PrmA
VVKIGAGSVADILGGRFPFDQASIVVANILSRILMQLIRDDIGQLLSEGGTLIFSGILEEEEEEIVKALGKSGFHIVERMGRQDWVGLAGQRG